MYYTFQTADVFSELMYEWKIKLYVSEMKRLLTYVLYSHEVRHLNFYLINYQFLLVITFSREKI